MAATIKLTAGAVVITSGVKLEDYKLVQKYAPSKLTLMGGEDNKVPVFSVGITNGHGSINNNGAFFSGKTTDGDGYATISTLIDAEGDVKEWIADEYGSALVNLGKLEETIPSVVEEIKTQRNAIIGAIEVC